jgi:hypothetical protein
MLSKQPVSVSEEMTLNGLKENISYALSKSCDSKSWTLGARWNFS